MSGSGRAHMDGTSELDTAGYDTYQKFSLHQVISAILRLIPSYSTSSYLPTRGIVNYCYWKLRNVTGGNCNDGKGGTDLTHL